MLFAASNAVQHEVIVAAITIALHQHTFNRSRVATTLKTATFEAGFL